MIKKIHPRDLGRYLWHIGPYIVYYKGKVSENNNLLCQNILKMSIKYDNLNLLEINWQDQNKYQPHTSDTKINSVYLYYKGMIKLFRHNPDENDIKDIFGDAIFYHNVEIDERAKNIGKYPRLKILNEEDVKTMKEKRRIRIYKTKLKSKKRKYLNRKLFLTSEEGSLKNSFIDTERNIKPKKNTINKKINPKNSIKNGEKINKNSVGFYNVEIDSTPWFYDPKISHKLPQNFIESQKRRCFK